MFFSCHDLYLCGDTCEVVIQKAEAGCCVYVQASVDSDTEISIALLLLNLIPGRIRRWKVCVYFTCLYSKFEFLLAALGKPCDQVWKYYRHKPRIGPLDRSKYFFTKKAGKL